MSMIDAKGDKGGPAVETRGGRDNEGRAAACTFSGLDDSTCRTIIGTCREGRWHLGCLP